MSELNTVPSSFTSVCCSPFTKCIKLKIKREIKAMCEEMITGTSYEEFLEFLEMLENAFDKKKFQLVTNNNEK